MVYQVRGGESLSQIDCWLNRQYNHRENWGEEESFVNKKEWYVQEGQQKETPLSHRHYRIVLDS
jgi:hypothetical protein